MKIINEKVRILRKGNVDFNEMANMKTYEPFSDLSLRFLSDLSASILKDDSYKVYNDVISFAFFIRKANLLKMKRELLTDNFTRLGRGLIFHIAPSNVQVNFAYSLTAGLLSGNPNIVKVSSKDFPQVRMLCGTIDKVLKKPDYESVSDYIAIIQYSNEIDVNDYFSSICHTRVIWGGDNTIAQIKKSPTRPRSLDISFANRYSACVLNAKEYINSEDKTKIAVNFYNDTYKFNQNACFSPRLIYWLGEPDVVSEAKTLFWSALYEYAKDAYPVSENMAIEKYMSVCKTVLTNDCITAVKPTDNLIIRCEAKELNENILDGSCSDGFFIEYTSPVLDDLKKFASKKLQTLSYFGVSKEELTEFVIDNGLLGIDRITEIGKAYEFSLIWDGINLITAMSRIITG